MLKTEGHHFLSFAFLTFSLTLTLTLEISSHSIIQYDALVRSLEAGRVGRVVAVGGRGDGASARQEPGAGQLEVAGHLPQQHYSRQCHALRSFTVPTDLPTSHGEGPVVWAFSILHAL